MTNLNPLFEGLPDDVRVLGMGASLPEALAVAPFLAGAEQRRMATFGDAARRAQFALGRLALRRLAGQALGMVPRDVALAAEPGGALYLPGVSGVYVSLAHSGGGGAEGPPGEVRALAAFADRPVGVDLERLRRAHPRLAARLFGPGENELLNRHIPDPDAAVLAGWVLKEAVLKAERTGLRVGLRAVRLAWEADKWGAEGPSGEWILRLALRDGFAHAVAWSR